MTDVKNERLVTGVVTSSSMDKTITVMLERKVPHPLYKKYIRRSTKIHAHDEDNQCKVGDLVTVKQCRPLSKSKSWMLVKIDVSSAA
jgi:small subunit ribosomal protein S17